MDTPKRSLACSFCGKTEHEVQKLIAGPNVFICDKCILQCLGILVDESDTFVRDSRSVFTCLENFQSAHDLVFPRAVIGQLLEKYLPIGGTEFSGNALLRALFQALDMETSEKLSSEDRTRRLREIEDLMRVAEARLQADIPNIRKRRLKVLRAERDELLRVE